MSFSVPVCHMCIKLSTECILNHIRMRTWKCMEFRCMFIEMKIRLVIFFIFLSVIELEFQMTGFLTCHFFIPFIRKLTQMLIGWFNRKTVSTVRFTIIKIRISMNFIHLRSKLTSEICQKIGSLDGKTNPNRLKLLTLPLFS